jgi:serine/threonine protein kinase
MTQEQDEADRGARFGKYRIVGVLGEGSFGTVFEAVLPGPMGFSRRVAIKRLNAELVRDDPTAIRSMVNEACIGGLLHHNNIVDTLELGQVGDTYFLAMEYVDGLNLAEIIDLCEERHVLLPRFVILGLAIQVCRGLHYAHCLQGPDNRPLRLIHRDLKPSNIIVDRAGTARILDFGIARTASSRFQTTEASVVKGTPRYMSPEQITAKARLTARSDLFSLGAVLYELITHKPLFPAHKVTQLIDQIVFQNVDPQIGEAEMLFPGVGPILTGCLAKEPKERYRDARALSDDLRALARDYPPETDIADIINTLLPHLKRPAARVIQDTTELELPDDEPRPLSYDPDNDTLPFGAAPLLEDLDERRWTSFSQAFEGFSPLRAPEETDETTADLVWDDDPIEPEEPMYPVTSVGKRTMYLAGAAALLAVLLALSTLPWIRGCGE